MDASITVTRSPELRGRQGTYEVTIDGTAVGALERGRSLTHPVPAGEHTVQVTRDPQHTSPHQKVTVAGDEQITLYASFISERAEYVRSPTQPSDWLILTTDGTISNGDGTTATPPETRTRYVLTTVSLVAFIIAFGGPSGPVKQAAFAVFFVATAVGLYLTVRYMRHLYRSPRDGL